MIDGIVPMLVALGIFLEKPCSPQKIDEILSPPRIVDPADATTWENTEVQVNCSVRLPPNTVVTKMLRFVGDSTSDVVFDCRDSKIEPDRLLQEQYPAIRVQSARSEVNGQYVYSRPANVRIENCQVYGSVRIASSYYRPTPDDEFSDYKNQTGPDYVRQLRETSPTRITLDNLRVHNDAITDSVYFEQGVTELTLSNSKIFHDAPGLSLYISAESGFNRIDNNEFHHSSHNKREVLALDSSEYNMITNNWFSGLRFSGIELYRNCGERGQIRYTGPRYNLIDNNIFYYSPDYSGGEPGVYIASRNGEGTRSYDCDVDAGAPSWDIAHVDPSWGWDAEWESSSTVDYDYARHNMVVNNRFCNRDPVDEVEVRNASFNSSNVVEGNQMISCEDSAPLIR